MTKILQTWTKLKTKFKNTLGDKQARIRLLSDKLSEADKELETLEWEKRWLERWFSNHNPLVQLYRSEIKAFTLKSGKEFKADFNSDNPTYFPSFWEFKELIALLREHYCREELKIKI